MITELNMNTVGPVAWDGSAFVSTFLGKFRPQVLRPRVRFPIIVRKLKVN